MCCRLEVPIFLRANTNKCSLPVMPAFAQMLQRCNVRPICARSDRAIIFREELFIREYSK